MPEPERELQALHSRDQVGVVRPNPDTEGGRVFPENRVRHDVVQVAFIPNGARNGVSIPDVELDALQLKVYVVAHLHVAVADAGSNNRGCQIQCS